GEALEIPYGPEKGPVSCLTDWHYSQRLSFFSHLIRSAWPSLCWQRCSPFTRRKVVIPKVIKLSLLSAIKRARFSSQPGSQPKK
ncbi:hypothetical protein, partial [Klebsiella grimontii]|uniref:hypothetical protein n=1 Tax=Klebsiella grimontii TaxID=2058152 RepID=UPI00292DB71C